MQSNHTSVRSRWGEKPYYSLDYYLKETFGQKVYKIALDAGMTCPNRDGTLDTRGCIFCSEGGSGDFATTNRSITAAIDEAICRLNGSAKETGQKYIAYFQSFSNTYAPIDILRPMVSGSAGASGYRRTFYRYQTGLLFPGDFFPAR